MAASVVASVEVVAEISDLFAESCTEIVVADFGSLCTAHSVAVCNLGAVYSAVVCNLDLDTALRNSVVALGNRSPAGCHIRAVRRILAGPV